jgi:hypothetical protein
MPAPTSDLPSKFYTRCAFVLPVSDKHVDEELVSRTTSPSIVCNPASTCVIKADFRLQGCGLHVLINEKDHFSPSTKCS